VKHKRDLPLLFTRPQLSKIFGKDARTIARWVEDGLPCEVKGRGGRPSMFSLPECVQWVIARELQAQGDEEAGELSPALEMAKLNRKRREELELRLQVRRGELVEVGKVQAEFAGLGVAVKARIRSVPDAIADQVVGVPPAVARRLMLARLDDALRELARGEVIVVAPPDAEADDDAPELVAEAVS